MVDPLNWYDANAEATSIRYEQVAPERIHGWLLDLLPTRAGPTLDVGAGSGRDAAWLASKGYEVVAVEPSAEMRRIARLLHAGEA